MTEALKALYHIYSNFSGRDKTEALARKLGMRILRQPWIQNGDAPFFESPEVCKIPIPGNNKKLTEEIAMWTFYHDSAHLILNGTSKSFNALEAEKLSDNFALAMSFAHCGDDFLLCSRLMDEERFYELLRRGAEEADVKKRAGLLGERIMHECHKIKKNLKGRTKQTEKLSRMTPLFRLANELRV